MIAWSSRKQLLVATSSTEAEYIAAAECCKEVTFLQTFIQEVTGVFLQADLLIDNQSAMCIMKRNVVCKRSKHFDVRYHYLKEKVENKSLKVIYCPTVVQIADLLTKALVGERFKSHRDSLLHSTSRAVVTATQGK